MTVEEQREELLTQQREYEPEEDRWEQSEEEMFPEAFDEDAWDRGEPEEAGDEEDSSQSGEGEGDGVSRKAQTLEEEKRDFGAEALELLQVYPQLRGRQLPDAVLAECARGQRLLQAYRNYESRENRAELQRLRRENEALRQNAEAARRAPVWGVSGGGCTDNSPADPFLDGFQGEF